MKKKDLEYTSDIAFTPRVKELQETLKSRTNYARMEKSGSWTDEVTTDLNFFLDTIDSFYLATANTNGQPYIQQRGGSKGFLKVLEKNV